MDVTLRPATLEDIEGILPHLRAFSEFFGSKIPLYPGDDYARDMLGRLIKDHVFIVASTPEGQIAGLIAGILGPHFMNKTITVLEELFWWVGPEFRHTKIGMELLRYYIAVGNWRADWVTMRLEAQSPVREETLTKRGFRIQERAYLMEVDRQNIAVSAQAHGEEVA